MRVGLLTGGGDVPGLNAAIRAVVKRGELAHGGVVRKALRRELTRRREDGQRDRQVEPGSLLAQGGRSEIDGDPAVERPLEGRGHDSTPNAVLRLLAGSVDEPDDGEAGDPRLQVRLDLDLPRLEADERMSDRACEHSCDGRREGATQG